MDKKNAMNAAPALQQHLPRLPGYALLTVCSGVRRFQLGGTINLPVDGLGRHSGT